ncbi:hypothetical protein [Embleya sp. NPDC050493]|uniref:hypothetical protein n=1 Tax=Embleya sp. NPDC050493 TaxID=3363989 RepID=UPI0037B3C772
MTTTPTTPPRSYRAPLVTDGGDAVGVTLGRNSKDIIDATGYYPRAGAHRSRYRSPAIATGGDAVRATCGRDRGDVKDLTERRKSGVPD